MSNILNAIVDENMAIGIPGIDFVVYKDGKCIYRYMRGTSSDDGTPIKGNEKYNVYSCSKLITCVAALKLWEEGRFDLYDEVATVLPEYKSMTVLENGTVRPAKAPMLIKHLFTMQSGLTYDTVSPSIRRVIEETNGRAPTREIIRALAQEPLAFDPGTQYLYSLSHDVLGAVIEVLSGMKLGEYLKTTIFDPLEMHDTTFLLPEDLLHTVCDQYIYDDDTAKYNKCGRDIQYFKFGSEYEAGGAGCVCTVDDYMKFLEGLRTGKLIKRQTIDMMTTNCLTPAEIENLTAARGYGYGLGVRCPKDDKKHDFGWGGAAGAFAMIDMELGVSAFYAQHVLNHSVLNTINIPTAVRTALATNGGIK